MLFDEKITIRQSSRPAAMTSISNDDKNFILEHPLTCLTPLRTLFKTRYQSTSNASQETLGRRDAILNLLVTLQIHPAARRLRSSQRSVDRDLASIYSRLGSDDFDLSYFTILTTLVANEASDLDVWQAVLHLILDLSRMTPTLTSVPVTYNGTPRTRTSASFQDSSQTRKNLLQPMLMELSGQTYVDVPEFYAKYFEKKAWSAPIEEIDKDNAMQNFPQTLLPQEDEMWDWWKVFQEHHLATAPNVYYQTKSKKDVVGTEGERQVDIVLKHRSAPSAGPHDIKHYLVVGELTKSDMSGQWKAKFAQLAIYIRDIFSAQPTRRFIHGFLIFGVQMQLWVFDRSGAYSSETFDVRQEPQKFIRVVAGYAMMTDEELGLDTFIEYGGEYPSVTLADAVTGKHHVFQLLEPPLFKQRAIACRGTLCYRTVDRKHVIKFAWRPEKHWSEVDHLERARGIKGIPTLKGSSTITSINELRAGLKIRKLRDLGHIAHERSVETLQSSFTSQSVQQSEELGVSGTKRRFSSVDEKPSKKSRSNNQGCDLNEELKSNDLDQFQSQAMPPPDPPFRNRILSCLAISPIGRPLERFLNVVEFLKAFRDAIKAHRSLFLDCKILHRDVSLNNIIITNPEQTEGYCGMLIDYDLAVQVDEDGKNEMSKEKKMTGTLEYMAIGILEGAVRRETAGIDHTYRHDLESFFYVFLAACIRYGWNTGFKPRADPLRDWYEGSFEQLARIKRGDVTGGFEMYVLGKFSPRFECFKGIARRLRDILFGTGTLYTNTPENPESLYGPMVRVLDSAIQDFEW